MSRRIREDQLSPEAREFDRQLKERITSKDNAALKKAIFDAFADAARKANPEEYERRRKEEMKSFLIIAAIVLIAIVAIVLMIVIK